MAMPLCPIFSNATSLSTPLHYLAQKKLPIKYPIHLKLETNTKSSSSTALPSTNISVDQSSREEDDEVLFVVPSSSDEEEEEEERNDVVAEYDWREEWYPLYLSKDVPDDAPLGLIVFDQQIVLYKDANNGVFHCYQDRCPHRLAKLSEGQLIDGRLECLYHGWQFEGNGKCVNIPQLPANAKIPRSACVKSYEVKESQGIVWVWMSTKTSPNFDKLPWFENFARPGFQDNSSTHELPYDHSILLENLMDPAHIPISHDRADGTARREDAQPLVFDVTERTDRGFAGWWGKEKDESMPNFLRFEAPCILQNNREFVDKNGLKHHFSALFLCRPTGQGRSMLTVRFGSTKISPIFRLFPKWYLHQTASKIFEQDMGFLSSQNEILMKEKVPTKKLYLNLRFSDTWVVEYRKWMDRVGHGMPYHFGHSTISLPNLPAVVEHAPAGFFAGLSASSPAKGGSVPMYAPNLTNRYFRHVVHCKSCSRILKAFNVWKNALSMIALGLTALAILVAGRQWKAFLLASATLCLAGFYVCSTAIAMKTTNFIRTHRRL